MGLTHLPVYTDPSGLKKLVQKAEESDALGIHFHAVQGKERRQPLLTQIAFYAARRQRQILKTIRHAQASAVDKATELPLMNHEVGQASITMGNHQILLHGAAGIQLVQQALNRHALAFIVKIFFINQARFRPCAGIGQTVHQAMIEGTGFNRQAVQALQGRSQ